MHRAIAMYRSTTALIASGRRMQRSQNAMKPHIASESRFMPTPPAFNGSTPPLEGSRRNIAMTFGMEKLECCLPDGEKNSKMSLFVLTECTNVTDGQTDTT